MIFDFATGELLLIDKPLRWTSFDAVGHVRGSIRRYQDGEKVKIGHAGTLDPLATGLLIMLTGRFTKKIPLIQEETKVYSGSFRIGATTPCFDLEMEVDKEYPTSHISENMILEAAKHFIGDQEQIPPLHSAVKIEGVRAYEHARKGVDMILAPKRINIISFEILNIKMPDITFRIECSKGTYIRALARDFGLHLQSGAHLTTLRRERIGEHSVENSMSPEQFRSFLEKIKSNLNS